MRLTLLYCLLRKITIDRQRLLLRRSLFACKINMLSIQISSQKHHAKNISSKNLSNFISQTKYIEKQIDFRHDNLSNLEPVYADCKACDGGYLPVRASCTEGHKRLLSVLEERLKLQLQLTLFEMTYCSHSSYSSLNIYNGGGVENI